MEETRLVRVGIEGRVRGPWELRVLVNQKRSVVINGHDGHMPAAMVLQMPCGLVLNWIERGMYVYERKTKKSRFPGKEWRP